MSQKGRLRRLDAGVRWLETEGVYLRLKTMMKIVEMLQEIADRMAVDPAFAARWKKDFPNFPYDLPPPGAGVRPAPPALPILREAALQATPRDEAGTGPAHREPPQLLAQPPPRPPEPAPLSTPLPMPGQPVSLPPPDMQIRPIEWRARGREDYYDDGSDTYGRCITEYDPLRDEDDE